MTSQGAGHPLNAFKSIDASRACLMWGNVRIQAYASDAEELVRIYDQDWAAWKYINFGKGANAIKIRVKPGKNAGRIDIALDQSWRPDVGSIQVPAEKGEEEWMELSANLKKISGVRALWLRFHGEGYPLFRIGSFRFMDE
jgi:arabinoxylan arabinofuranohydrolase